MPDRDSAGFIEQHHIHIARGLHTPAVTAMTFRWTM
jgi:hypothetical protein